MLIVKAAEAARPIIRSVGRISRSAEWRFQPPVNDMG
jgi:hypothetical protein